ncbi:hypothetical protein NQ317_013112 [Molorchus minor]|uniref:Uncharacterized protein n=1 Tax=Molorchus minor TaxID=1323400 RepID=A0ABQ9JX04_9CUCU|nr:hypothetical protein NQ317_013112 [Molorchus minor]
MNLLMKILEIFLKFLRKLGEGKSTVTSGKKVAWTWLSVSIDYRADIVRMDLDCHPSLFDTLTLSTIHRRISIPEDALVYFRQEPGRKKKFLGSMQVAKVLPYVVESRLWSCVQISPNLAPEYRKPIP